MFSKRGGQLETISALILLMKTKNHFDISGAGMVLEMYQSLVINGGLVGMVSVLTSLPWKILMLHLLKQMISW